MYLFANSHYIVGNTSYNIVISCISLNLPVVNSVPSALHPPSYVQAFCNVVVWRPPLLNKQGITGYDVRFKRQGITGTNIPKDADERFHVVVDGDIPSGNGDVSAQVRHTVL